MSKFIHVRLISALLLLLCFVLPLSKCTTARSTNQYAAPLDTYIYGYAMAKQGLRDIEHGQTLDGFKLLGVIFTVFFLPIVILIVALKWRLLLTVVGSVVTGYALCLWVLVLNPQIGGLLALGSWLALLVSAIWESLREYSHKSQFDNDAAGRST